MKFSIGTRIAFGYLLASLAIVSIGIVTLVSVNNLLRANYWVEHTYKVFAQLNEVYSNVVEVESGQRGYALYRDMDRLKAFNEGKAGLEKSMPELKELTNDNPEQQVLWEQLNKAVSARVAYSTTVVERMKAGDEAGAKAAIQTNRGSDAMERVREILQKMEKEEDAKMTARKKDSDRSARFTQLSAQTAIIGTPLALLLIGILVTRSIAIPVRRLTAAAEKISQGEIDVVLDHRSRNDEIGALNQAFARMTTTLRNVAQAAERVASGEIAINLRPQSEKDVVVHSLVTMVENLATLIGQVQRSGIQVNTSATEIAATARQQQATATEISATTMEIGGTSKEIAATSKELAGSMQSVAQMTEDTTTLAENGQSSLTTMENTMRQIMEASGSINSRLAVLSEKAGNINAVVTTITKVADQTNLLSLNAAIEAEKAGEYGRGFSVVATEIRRLADQTAAATSEVEQIVKEMQSAVAAGVMGMDKFSEEVRRGVDEVGQVGLQLSQIIQQVQAMRPNFESVNEGMQAQSIGAQQISEALLQLGDSARQTAESLTQSNAAIDQLNEASRGLQSSVSLFRLKSDGTV